MSAEENQPTTPTNPTPPTTPRKVSKLTPNTKGDGRTLPKLPPSVNSSQSQGDNSSFINLNFLSFLIFFFLLDYGSHFL